MLFVDKAFSCGQSMFLCRKHRMCVVKTLVIVKVHTWWVIGQSVILDRCLSCAGVMQARITDSRNEFLSTTMV